MKNKKGAEMTIGTIIIIVLALVVLVILVYGFSTGWTNLWEKITAFGGGKVNVQTVVQSCQLACTTSSSYDWCTRTRSVIFNADKAAEEKIIVWTCDSLQKDTTKNTGLEPCDICGGSATSITKTSTQAEATEFAADCGAAAGSPKTTCASENILLSGKSVVNKDGDTYYCCKI